MSEAEKQKRGEGKKDLSSFLPKDYGSQTEKVEEQLPEVIVEPMYCTHAKGSACQRCLSCCPHGAISLVEDAAPKVDADLCTGCGICVGICDAFCSTKLNMHKLHTRIGRIAVSGQRVFFSCTENIPENFQPAANVVVLPCLSMLSPILLTLLLSEGIGISVCCDFKRCEDCTIGGALGAMLYPRAIEIAQARTDSQILFCKKVPEKQGLLEKYTRTDDAMGRRAAFEDFVGDIAEITSGKRRLMESQTLQDHLLHRRRREIASKVSLANRAAFSHLVRPGQKRRMLFPQQKMLLESIDRKPEVAKNINVALSTTDRALCCEDHACTKMCPTGARVLAAGKLDFNSLLCVGCGICASACPNSACSVKLCTAQVYLKELEEQLAKEQEDEGKR